MGRGGDRRSAEAKSTRTRVSVDGGRSASARRTASIIGCNYKKTDKIRKIRRDGTPEIQEAVRNDRMTINKAHQTIRDMESGKDENPRNSAADTKAVKRVLTEENFERFNGLPGGIYEKIDAAVEYYLRSVNDEGRASPPTRIRRRSSADHTDFHR